MNVNNNLQANDTETSIARLVYEDYLDILCWKKEDLERSSHNGTLSKGGV